MQLLVDLPVVALKVTDSVNLKIYSVLQNTQTSQYVVRFSCYAFSSCKLEQNIELRGGKCSSVAVSQLKQFLEISRSAFLGSFFA